MPRDCTDLQNDIGVHIKLLWSEMDFKFYLEGRKDYTKREGVEGIHDEFNCMNKKSRAEKVQGILEIKK